MKFFLICFLSLMAFRSQAWVLNQEDFQPWFSGLKVGPETQKQLAIFFKSQSQSYSERLMNQYKMELSAKLKETDWFMKNTCKDAIQASFNEKLTSSSNSTEKKFESELLRIESIDCLPRLDLNTLRNVYLSDAFQLEYVEDLEMSRTDQATNRFCQKTDVFMIGDSCYCGKYDIWSDQNTIVITSLNDFKESEVKDFQCGGQGQGKAPVYFRAVTTIFKKIKNGVVMYNLVYGRGPSLPGHWLVTSTVESRHADVVKALVKESQAKQ